MFHDTKYYVSEKGSDRNNGSEKHPFKTVLAAKRAVNSLDFDHDGPIHIIFKDGVYSTDGCVFSAGDSGSDTSPIIYRAENAGKVRLISSDDQPTLDLTALSYVTFEGFVIENNQKSTVKFSNGCRFVSIVDCILIAHNSYDFECLDSSNLSLIGCAVHTGLACCIMARCVDCTISGCRALYKKTSRKNGALIMEDCRGLVVECCIFLMSDKNVPGICTLDGHPSTGTVIRSNIFVGNPSGGNAFAISSTDSSMHIRGNVFILKTSGQKTHIDFPPHCFEKNAVFGFTDSNIADDNFYTESVTLPDTSPLLDENMQPTDEAIDYVAQQISTMSPGDILRLKKTANFIKNSDK